MQLDRCAGAFSARGLCGGRGAFALACRRGGKPPAPRRVPFGHDPACEDDRRGRDDAEDDGNCVRKARKPEVAVRPEREGRAHGARRRPKQHHDDDARRRVEGQKREGERARDGRDGDAQAEKARDLRKFLEVDREADHEAEHEHGEKRVRVRDGGRELDHRVRDGDSRDCERDEHDVGVEGDGLDEPLRHECDGPFDRLLPGDQPGERVGAARHHDGVAGVEQAGRHGELGGEEGLHERQAEAPDVEPARVEQVEHPVAALRAAGERERYPVGDERAGKAERDKREHVVSELRGPERVHDGAGKREGEHDLAHALFWFGT